jgi:hypothetical protein
VPDGFRTRAINHSPATPYTPQWRDGTPNEIGQIRSIRSAIADMAVVVPVPRKDGIGKALIVTGAGQGFAGTDMSLGVGSHQ